MRRKTIALTVLVLVLAIGIAAAASYRFVQEIDVRSGQYRVRRSVVGITVSEKVVQTPFYLHAVRYGVAGAPPEWHPEHSGSGYPLPSVSPHYQLHGASTSLSFYAEAIDESTPAEGRKLAAEALDTLQHGMVPRLRASNKITVPDELR